MQWLSTATAPAATETVSTWMCGPGEAAKISKALHARAGYHGAVRVTLADDGS